VFPLGGRLFPSALRERSREVDGRPSQESAAGGIDTQAPAKFNGPCAGPPLMGFRLEPNSWAHTTTQGVARSGPGWQEVSDVPFYPRTRSEQDKGCHVVPPQEATRQFAPARIWRDDRALACAVA
jgi:hypothetical protein